MTIFSAHLPALVRFGRVSALSSRFRQSDEYNLYIVADILLCGMTSLTDVPFKKIAQLIKFQGTTCQVAMGVSDMTHRSSLVAIKDYIVLDIKLDYL